MPKKKAAREFPARSQATSKQRGWLSDPQTQKPRRGGQLEEASGLHSVELPSAVPRERTSKKKPLNQPTVTLGLLPHPPGTSARLLPEPPRKTFSSPSPRPGGTQNSSGDRGGGPRGKNQRRRLRDIVSAPQDSEPRERETPRMRLPCLCLPGLDFFHQVCRTHDGGGALKTGSDEALACGPFLQLQMTFIQFPKADSCLCSFIIK